MSKCYHLFISHSWAYGDAYEKLVGFLDASKIDYKNYSVPRNDPLHTNGTDKQLYEGIKAQIAHASVVLILAGVYASYSKWIDKEIDIAKNVYGKPVIAIQPWAAEKTSKKVKDSADRIVGWNTNSIVGAIKDLA